MLLAIDVGNTNTSLGVYDGDELRCELRLSTNRSWTRDEVAVAMDQTLALRDYTLSDVHDAVVACVVPPVRRPLEEALRLYTGTAPLVIGPGVKTGMSIRYDPPQEVGADRIVAAVAAHALHGEDPEGRESGVVVVDFGTATTFDVVSPVPEYLGGVIAPGIGISADALFSRASKLPRVELVVPPKVVGRNTVGAMQSGLVYGYISLVEGVVARIRDELPFPVRVVATGGLARVVGAAAQGVEIIDETLVLEGLRLIHRRNR